MKRLLFSFIFLGLVLLLASSKPTCKANPQFNEEFFAASAQPVQMAFNVEGQERQGLIYPSSTTVPQEGAPLVFVFHGHGGTAAAATKKFKIHQFWPEAVVAYLQGLPGTPGINDPEGKKTGWQKDPGQLGDRDIKFVDVALAQLQREYKIDPRRIYAAGFSNGGRFTNLLWNQRGEQFAAFCSVAGQGGTLIESSLPRSIFIVAGENDPLVPFETQLLSVALARKLLQTDPSQAVSMGLFSVEPGVDGLELATYLHPGGHVVPKKTPPLMVKFFQRHKKN